MAVLLGMLLKEVYLLFMVQLVVETDPKLSASSQTKIFLVKFKKNCQKVKYVLGTNPNCPVNDPQLIMEYFSAKPHNLGWDCAMLIIFFLALRIIAFLSLKVKLSLHNDNLLTHTRYFYQQLKSEGSRAAFGFDTRKSSGGCCTVIRVFILKYAKLTE